MIQLLKLQRTLSQIKIKYLSMKNKTNKKNIPFNTCFYDLSSSVCYYLNYNQMQVLNAAEKAVIPVPSGSKKYFLLYGKIFSIHYRKVLIEFLISCCLKPEKEKNISICVKFHPLSELFCSSIAFLLVSLVH